MISDLTSATVGATYKHSENNLTARRHTTWTGHAHTRTDASFSSVHELKPDYRGDRLQRLSSLGAGKIEDACRCSSCTSLEAPHRARE